MARRLAILACLALRAAAQSGTATATPSASPAEVNATAASTSISNLWPIGVVIVIGASVGSNGGINLQKVSITREVLKPLTSQRPYPLQPLWLLGFVAVVLGAIGDFAGLAFAPQSLLIPLGGTSLIANIWFARWCVAFGARWWRRQRLHCCCCCAAR
jgi:hypothetical protein